MFSQQKFLFTVYYPVMPVKITEEVYLAPFKIYNLDTPSNLNVTVH